ncbi:MAG: aminodeoxychorismate synthase component I [Sphingobium sp.]|nr:aminodeoxychorismate synthase component I [Sphingobium sp.]
MSMTPDSSPFLLLDDARVQGAGPAKLYQRPVEVITAQQLHEVTPALERIKAAQSRGLHAAGFLSYEAGIALEPKLASLPDRRGEGDAPLLWFGLFDEVRELDGLTLDAWLKAQQTGRDVLAPAGAVPRISASDYELAFDAVRAAIIAGDIYQANLTFPCHVSVGPDPVAYYRAVRPHAAAGHGALAFTGDHWLLSFSPELFFALEGQELTTRPMKGTALRSDDPAQDAANAAELRADPKQRAENLMIVDLLRNDLSRVAEAGSVHVPDLFTVESYPTVHQMVSTVKGRLRAGLSAVDALAHLFPCGSITGAPKIRAMEIIHQVEPYARGPYTGSIGVIEANGNALFNVAIRTITVKKGDVQGVIGLGSGLVVDSAAMSEWQECLDKGLFLSSCGQGARDERGGA